ncbi:MAG TPA: hypothetical protein VE891_11270, partial [Allosphingosinicella sp.]|nr:hypothetical protein [Allosphingosinicella sp.]
MVQLYARSGGESLVNTATQNWQANPRIARLGTGGYVVLWTDGSRVGGDASGYAVKGQIFNPAGDKVGGEILVNTATGGSQLVESVAPTASGGFVAVYLTENQAIRGQAFDSSGAKTGGEFFVTASVPNPGETNMNASVTALANGTIIVSWARWDPYGTVNNGEHVFARMYGATGVALTGEFRLDSSTTTPGLNPNLTALASGGWVATWVSVDDYDWNVVGQIYAADGTRVGGPFAVDGVTEGHQDSPVVVALAGGGFVVGWVGDDGPFENANNRGIKAQVFDNSGAKVGAELLVNTITRGAQDNFEIDDLPGGGFVVTWTDLSGLGGDSHSAGIMAQLFDSAGGKVGTEFLVNTITQGHQASPAVVALASGAFAVAWQSPADPSQYEDIKAQLFVPSAGAATDIALSAASVSEISLGNYAVATLSDNGGVNSARTYTLLADSTGGGFRIEGNRLVVADNSRLDHETAPSANLTIRVTDVNGASFDEVLSLAIADSAVEQRYTAQPEFMAADNIKGGVSGGAAAAGILGGTFVVAWADDDIDGGNSASSLKAQLYDPTGAAIGPAFAVNSSTPNHQVGPSVAGTALGEFVIVWEDGSLLGGDDSFSGIKGQRFNSLGTRIGGEFQVNTITEGFQVEASVAALSNGGFVVSWTDKSDNSGDIRAQVYNWEGARVGGELSVNTTATFGQNHIDSTVAGLPGGGFVVSWTNSQTSAVHAQLFDYAGTKTGGQIEVVGFTGRWGEAQPTLAILQSGHFVIAWTNGQAETPNQSGNFSSIQAQIFDPAGNKVGGQFLVNTTTDYYQTHVTISALPWGGFVASWQDGSRTGDDPSSNAVRAQIFDSAGGKVGAEFLVNKGADNDQGIPFSTILSSGGFVLGWTETYNDDIGAKTRFEGRVFSVNRADNSGNDTLIGDPSANLLDGGAGNDQIYGNGGNDDLRGGAGNDWLRVSGTGIVAADGGADFDYLAVNWGDSTTAITMGYPNVDPNGGLTGSIGDGGARRVDYGSINIFQITTGSGNDLVYGGQSGSSASLGGGDDRFYGLGGYETIDGGTGFDGVSAGLGLATSPIVWNLQTNSYSGPIGSYTNFEYFLGLFTGSANDIIVTTAATLNDIVNGATGDDTITVINGQDHAAGDFGNDLLIIAYSGSANAIVTTGGAAGIALGANSSGISGQIGDGGSRRVNFFDVDRFDVRTGSGHDNIVLGTGNLVTSDIVSLGDGNDFADFGRGTDQGDGGAGMDGFAADLSLATVSVSINLVTNAFSGPAGASFVNFEYFGGSGLQTGAGADVVVTGLLEQSDRVSLGSGDDIVTLYDGWDTVFGGPAGAGAANSGFDTLVLDYGASTAAISNIYPIQTNAAGASGRIGDGANRVATFEAIDRFAITTGSGNDSIATAGGNDEIRTGAGDDLLDGGAGADSMAGGAGNDLYFVDNSADSVAEASGEGMDEVRTSLAAYSLLGTHIENLTAGSNVNHDFRGSSASNFVKGGAGDDVLRLQDGGNDIVDAGDGADRIFFGATLTSADIVNGGTGVDTLALQGAYALTLGAAGDAPAGISGIETIALLSGADTNFGPAAGASSYQIILTQRLVGSGEILTIDGSGLGTAEQLYLDARAETDGSLVVKGGAGNDTLLAGGIGTILSGGGGNDQLYAGPAGSTLDGGAGADMLFGGRGSDVLRGGEGDDRLVDPGSLDNGGGASDSLDGQGGNDIVNFWRVAADVWTSASLLGGDGDDMFDYSVESFGALSIDAGSGNDTISISTNAALTRFSLGTGQDVVTLNNHQGLVKPGGSIAISDFETGAAGDKLDWRGMLRMDMALYTEGRNPFLTGHARLVQDGSDVLLQIDRRTGGADPGFRTIIRFENRNIADFTAANFDGFDPTVGTGTAGADTLRGEAGDDILNAGDGNDALHLWNGGGNDTALGGAGNDNFFFGATLNSADIVNGGDGNDTLVLQGDYAGGLTLTAKVTNIELISILAGSNTNFGEPGTNRHDYVLTTHDSNFSGAIQVRVNGSALLEGEDFTFDGSAELDSRFVVYGGRGVDTLTGSRNNDIFFLAEERFATGDTVNGGAGYDGMFLRGNYTIDFNAPGYTGLFTNIENLTLTSATDERYARGGGSEFDYDLTLSDAIVNPGATLTVSGALLMASETMILDGSAESDGLLNLFGGKADDTLKGGGQSDILYGNLGADQLTGNGGADVFRYNES